MARRSRPGIRHVHHRRTGVPHRYILAENTTSSSGGGKQKNNSSPPTRNNNTAPPTAPAAEQEHHRNYKHRIRNWIIGFVVGSLAGVISGLGVSVLFRLALNCIRGRYRTKSGMVIFTPKLIKRADHLAFLEKEDMLSSLAVIGRGGCGEVFKAQLPVESEGEEPKFIAIKKIKKQARIADFGLAKAMPDEHTHVSTSHIAGTMGYIAPEYHQSLKFTAKCDIYSFGVILAVLATGKEPTDQFFVTEVEEVGLVKWLRRVVQNGDYAEAIDPAIAGAGHEEQIMLVLRIAVFCTADEAKERPEAKDVRCMLAQIKN
ncbi:Leucine-rich repeat receptor-like serine/threonine/tyrosine-protein kinase SOBIR1 [Triticum urartu]|uniref:Leucine-rich repeat receptor-like serine/threonine/tyrosine-protein kinase SOBIR1 n=1 Tax=Triticum urartu TaxID=4572 RepID=M7ZPA8_TRIUA|nr:Leucine-rich repeat receptor-like serine/threonine/tyrosine-protein kinase SOBIR1 [Triticum urartu]